MTWQTYIDILVNDGTISRAAILGQAGGVWASSPGYDLSPDQMDVAICATANLGVLQQNGIKLADEKFFYLTNTERSVYGKKGSNGCLIVKTKQAVLVAEYNAPTLHVQATAAVEKLADYLIELGY